MGGCGCGDGYDYRLPAPKGWYLIKVYGGCNDCETPAGVFIDYETEAQFAVDLPEYSIKECTGEGLSILSIPALRKALLQHIGKDAKVDDDMTFGELVDCDDPTPLIFGDAIHETQLERAREIAEHEARRKKAKKKAAKRKNRR